MAHPLQMSPIKSGGKFLTGEKDKWARQRTVSTSEGHAQVSIIFITSFYAPPQKKGGKVLYIIPSEILSVRPSGPLPFVSTP